MKGEKTGSGRCELEEEGGEVAILNTLPDLVALPVFVLIGLEWNPIRGMGRLLLKMRNLRWGNLRNKRREETTGKSNRFGWGVAWGTCIERVVQRPSNATKEERNPGESLVVVGWNAFKRGEGRIHSKESYVHPMP